MSFCSLPVPSPKKEGSNSKVMLEERISTQHRIFVLEDGKEKLETKVKGL